MFRHLTSCLLGNLSCQCFMSSLSSHCNRFHLPVLLDSLTKELSVPKCHQNWFKLWFSNLLQKEMILSSSGSSRGYGRIKDDESAQFWNVVKHWILCWSGSGSSSSSPRRCQGRKEQRGIPEPKHGAERFLNVAVVAVLQVCQHDDDWKYWCRQTALAVQSKHSGSRGEKPRAAQNHSKLWQNNTKYVGKIQLIKIRKLWKIKSNNKKKKYYLMHWHLTFKPEPFEAIGSTPFTVLTHILFLVWL